MDSIKELKHSTEQSAKCFEDFDFNYTDFKHDPCKIIEDDSDEEDNFNYEVFSENLDEEANNFVERPTSKNIFYPNIQTHKREFFLNHQIPSLKNLLLITLTCEMKQQIRLKAFRISTAQKPECMDYSEDQCKHETKCISPDLFSSCSSDEEEITNAQKVSEPVNKIEDIPNFAANLISEVEKFMIKLLQNLLETNTANISVVNCIKWENNEFSNGRLSLKNSSKLIHRNINFKNSKSRNNFAIIMYVLSEVYHLLMTGSTCTERELYYKDPELIANQGIIHSAIKDVCCILNASPWELGIRHSSKGLICGAINIHMSDDSVINCYFNDRATLIPNDIQAITFIETTAKFVLIVEKDTIFQKILLQNILRNLNVEIILITGKGYPDLGTRLIVKRIWDDFHLPIYVLVDADPFGIEIMFVYRYGSKAMACSADQLACPHIRWIGIRPSEIETLAIPTKTQTKNDTRKIIELLQRTYINTEIRNELEILQRLGRKAETEAVAGFSANFLVYDYILNKIERNLVI